MKSFSAKLLNFFLAFVIGFSPSLALQPLSTAATLPEMTKADEAWLAAAKAAESFTVQLKAPSWVMQAAQNPVEGEGLSTGSAGPQPGSPEAQRYIKTLNRELDRFIAEAERLLGRKLEILQRYDYVLNGFSAKMSLEEAAILRQLRSVREVYADRTYVPSSDASPEFLGADQIWYGDALPQLPGKRGQGVRVAIIDTGINVSHTSFEGSTFGYTFPPPPEGYLGLCKTRPASYTCNNKLIGIYDMLNQVNGWDQINHGSHVAGIVAGNMRYSSYQGVSVEISGIAPWAQILSYKVCDFNDCPSTAVIAAINQAVADKAQVISLGVVPQSGPTRDPWQDPTDLALLEAMESGIISSTSAGNFGPDSEKIYRAAPWALVTGSTQHGRIFGYSIYGVGYGLVIDTIAYPARADLAPKLVSKLQSAALVKDAVNNPYGCKAWPAGSYTNRVALVKRGVCNFQIKVDNFRKAGGSFILVYDEAPGVPPFEMGTETGSGGIPAAMLSYETGSTLMNYDKPFRFDIQADWIAGSEPAWRDILSMSSARGPIPNFDLLKPDLVAPGLNIFSAYAAPNAMGLMSGTTMAAAQVAGAAAIMKSVYPHWSPSAIQSALIMTAKAGTTRNHRGEDVTSPFEYGNGRLDLTQAALAGMVMEETPAKFRMADPNAGGDPRNLNIPSYQNRTCLGSCTFARTFTNVTDQAATYSISFENPGAMQIETSPQGSFTIPAGGTQQLMITLRPALGVGEAWQTARVVLKTDASFPNGKKMSDLAFSMAAKTKSSGSNLPTTLRHTTFDGSSQVTLKEVQFTAAITSLNSTRYGLAPAAIHDFNLAKDPTTSYRYDDLSQVWYTSTTCPADQERMVVEVLETTARDLDVFVGTGTTPQSALETAKAVGSPRLEYLNIARPAFSGPCWIMVQNFSPSTEGVADSVKLAVGFVPRTIDGVFTVTGPASVPALAPFEIGVNYSLTGFTEPNRWAWYGYLTLGSAAGKTDDIGIMDVNLYKTLTLRKIPVYLPLINR